MQYVLDMLLLFFKECMKKESACQDMWYKKQLETMQQKDMDIIKIMQILMRGKDMLLRSDNLQMLIDQLLYEMKEVTR